MYKNLVLLFVLVSANYWGQNNPSTNGVHEQHQPTYVFKNATIHVDGDEVHQHGMLIIKGKEIIHAGGKTKYPKGAIVEDLNGKHIYPSFIDLNTQFGIENASRKKNNGYPQYESSKEGPYYWNEAIKTENKASELFKFNDDQAKEYRNQGFGTLLTHQHDGISRGAGALITLEKDGKNLINDEASLHFSFKKGVSNQVYPSSLMGIIALLRQYFIDLDYYKNYPELNDYNLTLESHIQRSELPEIFTVDNALSVSRAHKIAEEFDHNFILVGNGDEYQAINDITENTRFILPLNFPKSYEVSDPFEAQYITLTELKHWELAPSNPKVLNDHNIEFCLTSSHLKKKGKFLSNLRKAVKRGLPTNVAINALTKTPAAFIKNEKIGKLEKDRWANFIITSDDILNDNAVIYQNWIKGNKHVVKPYNFIDVRGKYRLHVNQITRELIVNGSASKPKGKVNYTQVVDSVSASGDLVIDKTTGKPIKISREQSAKAQISVEDNYINVQFAIGDGVYRLGGTINYKSSSWDGRGQNPLGEWIEWSAIQSDKHKEKDEEFKLAIDSVKSEKFNYPMIAYGWDSLPEVKSILIKGATLWTMEDSVLLKKDLLVQDGKIAKIGDIADIADPNAIIIDGSGLHVTPGIIDEHSHIAIQRGVNEGSHAVSAEVRIGDVVRNDDVNIYRQLAGGVTACQLLHGSANPIGGQSALIKLRWGLSPDAMKIKDADGFIKFALGENVKQSNWGSKNVIRFPQTRMGVEQVYYDIFTRAKEYESKWKAYHKNNEKKKKKETIIPPKRDLQLETVLEIVNSERFISCHSYVQSEINMLMHVADSMGFTVNTFTHILEGYKVADKMKEHGVGGSTFSDWWAYKYEVKDAIPYNASLMNQMGITTAINSDDAEMGRRLNQEAAKGVKYGGMSEIEALKMVTLNPAKLLHLDERMGSIKIGKDADLVIWTDHPLSIYAKVNQTIIDGIVYFDIDRDKQLKADISEERQRIINKMITANKNGADTQPIKAKKQRTHVCTSIDENEK